MQVFRACRTCWVLNPRVRQALNAKLLACDLNKSGTNRPYTPFDTSPPKISENAASASSRSIGRLLKKPTASCSQSRTPESFWRMSCTKPMCQPSSPDSIVNRVKNHYLKPYQHNASSPCCVSVLQMICLLSSTTSKGRNLMEFATSTQEPFHVTAVAIKTLQKADKVSYSVNIILCSLRTRILEYRQQ